jgi:hypothetical protein
MQGNGGGVTPRRWHYASDGWRRSSPSKKHRRLQAEQRAAGCKVLLDALHSLTHEADGLRFG